MDRREMVRAASPHARRNRGLGLGVAVPAVVSIGALPAFAEHSGLHEDDDVQSMLMDESDEVEDEFGDSRPLGPEDGDPEEPGTYELVDEADEDEASDEEAANDGADGDEASDDGEGDEAEDDASDDGEGDEAEDDADEQREARSKRG